MLISIPYSLGFLLIGFASHSSMLYIGRILDGAMIGFSAPSAQIFVSFYFLFLLIYDRSIN
jgi:facilitated trehalose transporter